MDRWNEQGLEQWVGALTDGLPELDAWSEAQRLSGKEAEAVLGAVLQKRDYRPGGWLERLTAGIDRTVARIERHTTVRVRL